MFGMAKGGKEYRRIIARQQSAMMAESSKFNTDPL